MKRLLEVLILLPLAIIGLRAGGRQPARRHGLVRSVYLNLSRRGRSAAVYRAHCCDRRRCLAWRLFYWLSQGRASPRLAGKFALRPHGCVDRRHVRKAGRSQHFCVFSSVRRVKARHDRQNLRAFDLRDAWRGPGCRRRHGRLCSLCAQPASCDARGCACADGASRRPGAQNAADRRCARRICSAPRSKLFAPDILQLHGAETPARVAAIREKFGRPVMKAIGLQKRGRSRARSAPMKQSRTCCFSMRGLANAAALPGGNGRAFDWTLLAGRSFARPWLLAADGR